MSGIIESLSIGRAWDRLTSLLHAFLASSSSSLVTQGDLQELRKLERTMTRIRATLHDAEEHWNIHEESAKLRLRELKQVACDAEDVVEEYEYEVNRYKVEALEKSASVCNTSKRKRHEEYEPSSMDTTFVAPTYQLILRAREITDRFQEIVKDADLLMLSENDGERRLIPDISCLQNTTSLIVEKSIVGRKEDNRKIVEQIMSRKEKQDRNPVSVMAIVGMGGLGKTTLAQLVYNNLRLRQLFDKYAWISVSQSFDVCSITQNIFCSLANGRCEHTEFSDLQEGLANEIQGKRVLVVLDNMWNERSDHWELLCMPLSTTRFCQILVTTRSEAVARLVQTIPFYHLKCLSSKDSWSLFKKTAFSVDHEYDTPTNLIEMGKSIVKKCKGLPLAIKTLGSMLRYETDEMRWEVLLENELWHLEQPRNEVLPALELSYKNMPLYLRRCFVALSLFPKDHSLDDNEVIRLWKLLDMLHCDGNDNESEIGRLYLKQLVQRSILEVHNRGLACFYRLHDLIHDLACLLSVEEFYRLEGDTFTEIGPNVLYMSILDGASVEIPVVPHCLRAIILMGKQVKIKDPKALFTSCKKLRALHIEDRSLVEALPDFMGCLKLLRHLSFGVLRDAPSAIPIHISMAPFYNLQTLDLSVYNSHKLMLCGISRLINLHTLLPEMRLGRCGCSCNIRELRNINKIRNLRIYGLGDISHLDDANQAKMQSKIYLRSLDLGFSVGVQHCQCMLQPESAIIPHDQLLHSLQPHRRLCELSIWDYESPKYPSWLGNDSFYKLTRIVLYRFGSQYLPSLAGLPSLKHLKICDMGHVKLIGQEFYKNSTGYKGFPSLRNLEFVDMFHWSEWSGPDDDDLQCLQILSIFSAPILRSIPYLYTLRELYIEGCPGLSELPDLPSLSLLSVEDCSKLSTVGDLLLLVTLRIRHCSNLSALGALPSLTTLKIRDCSNLNAITTLPLLTSFELRSCPNLSGVSTIPLLTSLKIEDCPNLNTFGSLPSLSTLEIENPVKDEILHRLLNYHPSLKCLKIKYQTVTYISIHPQSLPILRTLHMGHCPNLQYCDGIAGLTSLQELQVWGCPKLPVPLLHPRQLNNMED